MAYLLTFSTVLLTVCLFIPCVTLCCCMCRTALLYLGQVAVVNENLFSTTWLNQGEIYKIYIKNIKKTGLTFEQ